VIPRRGEIIAANPVYRALLFQLGDDPSWVSVRSAAQMSRKRNIDCTSSNDRCRGLGRTIMKRVAPLTIILLFASACAGGSPVSAPSVTSNESYRLGVGDHLKIDVYNEPKLSGEFVIDGDGKLAFPLVGRVDAGNETLSEFSESLTHVLANGYLLNPNISVQVVGFRSVYVLGEVSHPGQYPFAEHMTVYTLVAQAGGFTYRASRREIALRRDGDSDEHKVRINAATAVRPGDTIRILERYF
jgi:polysaccharide biosynthesis/export protein